MELNGQPVDPDAVRALALTNYGHFTSMRVEDGRVRGLALHLERLARDCRAVFGTRLDTDRVRAYLRGAVDGRAGSFVVRMSVFDPSLDIGRPSAAAAPQVLVTSRPAGSLPLPPMRVMSVPYVRDAAEIKHTGLFGALHARRTAQLAGYDDALFHGPGGQVSEGGTWNVGFVDARGGVVWPRGDVLPGVTMTLLQRRNEHTVREVPIAEARGMRAAFATNTSVGVRALAAVDGTELSTDDPVLAALRAGYLDLPGDPV